MMVSRAYSLCFTLLLVVLQQSFCRITEKHSGNVAHRSKRFLNGRQGELLRGPLMSKEEHLRKRSLARRAVSIKQSTEVDIESVSDASGRTIDTSNIFSSTAPIPPQTPSTEAPQSNCKLLASNKSISQFRHNVYYYELNFVYMNLVPSGGISFNETKGIVGRTTWVWTFYGKQGALEFLDWPIEFEIWSMGLLIPYIRGPYDIVLYKDKGNCDNLVVGLQEVDKIISEALVQLPIALMNISDELKEKYGPSFFCYKRRMFLNPKFFYVLCKHIVCPVEAIKYQCCSYFFNTKLLKREITCDTKPHEYDSLWWVGPIVIAVILFAYVPLLLMNIAWKLSVCYQKRNKRRSLQNLAANDEQVDRIVYLDDTFPVTLSNTLWDPIANFCFQKSMQSSRVVRFMLPFLSLSVIILQVILDRKYLHGFILESIKTGVPLGFRSIGAGYEKSRHNFMPLFGGPYITISLYLLFTCMAVTAPSSLSDFLADGLQARSINAGPNCALIFDLRTVERLGSVPISKLSGFHKIYNTYLGQFYMLLNIKFWKEVWFILANRWLNFASKKWYKVLLPFYVLLCIIEVFLCIAINGFPIISFTITITRAYSFFNVFGVRSSNMRIFYKLIIASLSLVSVLILLFFLYIFCTIFMDATLFVTRLFIFTYTGIVIYPKLSYGYLIFGFTVFYYLWDCVKNYSMFYWRLLKVTVYASEKIQRRHNVDRLVIPDNQRQVKGIKASLFEHVIETHCPRRKQVFVSLLKLVIILGIIGVSLGLLTKTDKFQELHVLMHVGTAMFTCALPMILKSMCKGPEKGYRNKMFEIEVRRTVVGFIGYLACNSETDEDSD